MTENRSDPFVDSIDTVIPPHLLDQYAAIRVQITDLEAALANPEKARQAARQAAAQAAREAEDIQRVRDRIEELVQIRGRLQIRVDNL